jgi:hypothetical protein
MLDPPLGPGEYDWMIKLGGTWSETYFAEALADAFCAVLGGLHGVAVSPSLAVAVKVTVAGPSAATGRVPL